MVQRLSPLARRARRLGAPAALVLASVLAVLGAPGVVPGAGAEVAVDPTPSSSSTTAPPSSTTTTTTAPTTTTTAPATTTTSTTEPGVTTTLTTIAPFVPSPGTRSTADQLKDLTSQYDELTLDELELLTKLLKAQDKAKTLADQVDALTRSADALGLELAEAQRAVDRAEARAADVEDRAAAAEDELVTAQERLRAQAVQAYMGGGLGDGMASANVVLKSGSANDLGSSLVYVDAVANDQRQSIRRVSTLRDQVGQLRADAAAARDDAVRLRDDLAGRTAAVQQQRDRSQDARRQADEAIAEEQVLLVQVAAKRSEYIERITLASAASGGIAGTLHDRQVGQELPLITAGAFASPLAQAVVSSVFGPRPDPFGGAPRVHQGIDFSAPTGTPIFASADGIVVIASDQGGYGNCTVIDHGNGLGTLYGHQSKYNVEIGDRVTRGQVIGFVGSTGHSTGPHLHWEVRQFGQPVDPLPFLGSA